MAEKLSEEGTERCNELKCRIENFLQQQCINTSGLANSSTKDIQRHQLFTTERMLSQEQQTTVNLRLLSLLPRGYTTLFHAKQRKIFSHSHNIQNIQQKCLIFSSVPLKRSPEPKINHQSPLQAVLKGRSTTAYCIHQGLRWPWGDHLSWRGPELFHVFHTVWMTISCTAYEKTIAETYFLLPVGGAMNMTVKFDENVSVARLVLYLKNEILVRWNNICWEQLAVSWSLVRSPSYSRIRSGGGTMNFCR